MLRSAMLFGLALLVSWTSSVLAAPQIQDASLRGLTIGKTTRLTLSGKQLGPNPDVKLDFPVSSMRVLPQSNGQRLELEIDLPTDAKPQHGHLRVATATGISNPITLGIDSLPEAPFSATIDSLPIAFSGTLTGPQLLSTSFTGKSGQRLVIDVEAQRIGSKLQPLVSIEDERGTQLAYSSRDVTTRGDARLIVKLPGDGLYTIKLQDVLFRGGTPGHFRVKIGDFAFADMAFPLAVNTTDDVTNLKLLSTDTSLEPSLPGWDANNPRLTNLAVEIVGSISGPQPTVLRSDLPEVSESDTKDVSTSMGTAPIGISGILREPKERDEYLIDVTPGTKYRAEVFAQRIDSPVDAVLEIRKPDGAMLASSDDQNDTPDPAAIFDVPQELSQLKLVVRDLSQAAGPNHAYRVVIASANRPDFYLHVQPSSINIPAGGSAILEVVAERRGFDEAIVLSFPQLPEGVTTSLHEIPARTDRALVTLTATSDAKGASVGPIVGESEINGQRMVREAAIGSAKGTFGLAPETSQLGFGVVQKPKLLVAWNGELPENALNLGQVTALPITVKRAEGQSGPVRFSLVTSQVIPEDKGKPDLSKAIKLAKEIMLEADQSDATVNLSAPQELNDIAWDIAVKAELLADDKKKVLATAVSPAKRFSLGSPLFLALNGETVVRLKGTISRAGGFNHPVIVAANGLPKDAKSAAVEVPADKSEFTLEITLPANVKLEELTTIKLVATAQRNGKDVTSNLIPIRLESSGKQ
ncbi:hypothetical protein DTL21_20030 [Bremerella cremea]|uniref:Serine protease n=1 Tax=Blastopirellula marina TaxID=124 RepID=A0A2S8FK25_9BACT|nr:MULTISPECIES: hypothetical protein [Pirellulaceae]PQO32501.1 hypothetical protein C5Y83_20010 [Blastopirellula marina]RCS45568.1 hypothetical protein DTL21_20030 [Bremerella cremea]